MSETDQFWQFAKEAIVSIGYAKATVKSRICLSLRDGRKRHYNNDASSSRSRTTRQQDFMARDGGLMSYGADAG